MNRTDKHLLKTLYRINSKSGKEHLMKSFLKSLYPFEEDTHGNLYLTKGESETYPCFVAHLDEVHSQSPDIIIENSGFIFGFSVAEKSPTGIGADDKNGIFVCLKMLEYLPEVKIALFVEEETGGRGSRNADVDFFDDCRWVIECDRKNGSNMITEISGSYICSKAFKKRVLPLATKFGYKETTGLFTDVDQISSSCNISCLNLSCGYYNPHSDEECTVISELENCIHFCLSIAKDIIERYEFTRPKTVYKSWNGYDEQDCKDLQQYYGYSNVPKRGDFPACKICPWQECKDWCSASYRHNLMQMNKATGTNGYFNFSF
jgi:putative aminopeptidase FrvX